MSRGSEETQPTLLASRMGHLHGAQARVGDITSGKVAVIQTFAAQGARVSSKDKVVHEPLFINSINRTIARVWSH